VGILQWESKDSLNQALNTALKIYTFGLIKNDTNNRYEGQFFKGKKDGKGKCTWASGDTYEGYWKEDKKHGRGVYKWPDGERHEGQFEDGIMHGEGTRREPNGKEYRGLWENDKLVRKL
jgi:hypothetical protein